jgi:hypothetical protein
MFGDPGPVEWALGALLLLRLVERWRMRGAGADPAPPTAALVDGAWLVGLVMFAIPHGEIDLVWAPVAAALLAYRAATLIYRRQSLPAPILVGEHLAVPLALGLWPYAILGAVVAGALAWSGRAARR